MNNETIEEIITDLRQLPHPTPGFNVLDLVTAQPMTLPSSEFDIEYIEGPVPETREEDNICTLGR